MMFHDVSRHLNFFDFFTFFDLGFSSQISLEFTIFRSGQTGFDTKIDQFFNSAEFFTLFPEFYSVFDKFFLVQNSSGFQSRILLTISIDANILAVKLPPFPTFNYTPPE